MKIFYILCVLSLTVMASQAQDSQPAPYDSGWFLPTNAVAPVASVPTSYPLTSNPTNASGSSAIAEAITPDISALARNLENNPTLIFNYVHDHIRYVHYFGSHKGAEMTLLERSGNDFDQCALLVALFRAAGISASYQFGLVSMPYTETNQQDYQHWVGSMVPNTNWSIALQMAGSINGNFGYPYTGSLSGDTNDLYFHHVWVQATVSGTNYNLDPAFKVYQPIAGLNLDAAMQLSTNTLIPTVLSGSTSTTNYVQGLNENGLRSTLGSYNSNLLSFIQNNCPNATVQQIISGESVASVTGLPLGQPTPFTTQTLGGQLTVSTWSYIPTNLMAVLIVNLPGTNCSFYLPGLNGSRLSIVCTSNGFAQLWQEDTMLMSVPDTGSGSTFTPTLGVQHPFGTNWSFTTAGFFPARYAGKDQSVSTQPYQCTNATYVLLYGFDANSAWLTERQHKLDGYLEQGYVNASQAVTCETLNIMGLGWLTQTELAQQLLAGQTATIKHFDHRLGRMALETGRGYYIDVYEQVLTIISNDSLAPASNFAQNQAFQIGSYFGSAMEHGIIEQLQNSNLAGASTVKLLELASTNNERVYLATAANWTTGANVSGSISNYSTSSLYTSFISQGYYLLLPQNGAIQSAGTGSWKGSGYVAHLGLANGAEVSKMIIGGGYNGGYVSDPTAVPSTVYIDSTDVNQPTYFNSQSATDSLPTPTGADPVNLVDGSFQVTATDLALGQTEPRGLNLGRYYSSARRNSNLAGMAPGWINTYSCTAVPNSAPLVGLGSTTPQQMVPMIVAVRAAANIYNSSQPTPMSWVTTALIAKWGIDQLIKNAVSVNLGNATLQFVKQPDGSFTPPANCTSTLSQTNGAYIFTERHGRTFAFNTNSLLTNIIDRYGQSLKLTYNTSNWVHTVTDWTNRTLTFTYTGTNLTLVSDGTRSISYGYTGGNLTSFTDPEGKVTTYAYDANHQIIALFDAFNRLVITNSYDGYGHITTQLSGGNTNKAWQIYASGYSTVEIDPAGGVQEYTYDDKSRETAFQDALGNLTQLTYDGQDHVIQTISPLGETNEFVYDGNNNPIQSIDALGFTNQSVYNSLNSLVATIDPLGHSNTFGYNAQFSLIGQTNGAGDWINFGYNANGTLANRSDSGGTTSYGYDSFGQLNLITYPGGLGSESFVNSAYGDTTIHTDARGFAKSFKYNGRRQLTNSVAPTNLTASVFYDAVGNEAATIDARANLTTNTWSVTRHQLSAALPATPLGVPIITNGYDNRDWVVRTADPLSNITLYTNDLNGHVIGATDPVLRTTTFNYDAVGHTLATINAAHETNSQTWDPRGSPIKLTDGAGHYSLRAYDAAGNQIALTNRNGKKWQFQFDAANRLTNTISPLSRQMSVTFNHQGLPTLLTDPMGQHTTNTFDARGRLITRGDKVGTTTNSYDGNNNLTNVVENGNTNVWTYDAYNRVSSYRDIYGNLIQYRYDANANLTNLIYPGNRNVYYAYDTLNRLTNVTDWSNRKTRLAYDLDSHLTSITRPNGTYRTVNYDAAGQVTHIWEQMPNGLPIAWFRLNWTNSGTMAWEFAAPLPHTNSPASRAMTYNADNQLATVNTEVVTNDLDGNLLFGPLPNLTSGLFTNLVYDSRNRLLSSGGITNAYDAINNRIGQVSRTNTTVFVVNPNAPLPQVLLRIKDGVTNYYIYGAGLLYQITEGATSTNTLTYHYDYRGSTVALSADSGLVTDRIEYALYGLATYRTGTNDTPFLFNGRYGIQTDPNGLLYMRSRYYNPYICRFVNPDPSGFKGGLNFYAYANGNPVSYLDPFGLNAQATGDSDNSSLYNQMLAQSSVPDQTDSFDRVMDFAQSIVDAPNQIAQANGIPPLAMAGLMTAIVAPEGIALFADSSLETAAETTVAAETGASSAAQGAMLQQQLAAEEAAGAQMPQSLTGYLPNNDYHGLDQAISRPGGGVSPQAILDAWQNPVNITGQSNGRFLMEGQNATIVVNSQGQIITTWATSSAGLRIIP